MSGGALSGLVFAWCLASAPAHAHVPHDMVESLGVPLLLNASRPWYLIENPGMYYLVLKSDSAGAFWDEIGGPFTADDPQLVSTLDDGSVVLVGVTRWWWSQDGGVSWDSAALDAPITGIANDGDTLYLWGPEGVVSAEAPGAAWTDLLAEPNPVDLEAGPGGLAIALDDGSIYGGPADALELLGTIEGASSVALTSAALYVGDAAGQVWRWDGEDFLACTPFDLAGEPTIIELAGSDGALFAATATRAPWRSEDGCDTWVDSNAPDMVCDAIGVAGGPDSVEETFTGLYTAAESVVISGWNGVATSPSLGVRWSQANVAPADYTRGLAFGPAGRLFIGGNGGGPAFSDDRGTTFTAPSLGLMEGNVQQIVPDPVDPAFVLSIIGHNGWRSDDGGSSWTPLDSGLSYTNVIWNWGDVGWLLGTIGGAPGLIQTTDWTTYEAWPGLDAALGAGEAAANAARVVLADGTVLDCAIVMPTRVLCSADGGQSWTEEFSDGGGTIGHFVGFPDGAADRFVMGSAAGLWVSRDLGQTWTLTWSDDLDLPIDVLATEAWLFAVTKAGRVLRSSDGDGWEDIGVQVGGAALAFVARPGFEAEDDLLIATHDGVFRIASATADPTYGRFAAWQIADDESAYVEEGCLFCTQVADKTAALGTLTALANHGHVEMAVRGDTVILRGTSASAGATLTVSYVSATGKVEAEAVLEPGATTGIGELGRIVGLPGWHTLSIEATGEGIALDGVDAVTTTEPLAALPDDDTGETGGDDTASADDGDGDDDTGGECKKHCCGCTTRTGAPGSPAWVSLGIVALVARRRRR